MRIGELAKQTGFSTDTIRWYEKIGLIKLDREARTTNNYRKYDHEHLQRLLLIKQIKSLGFTLKEIEHLLILREIDRLNCNNVSSLLQPKVDEIDRKIMELQQQRSKLITVANRCTGQCLETMKQHDL